MGELKMALVTHQERVDELIKSFWKNGYLTLSRRYGKFLPDPSPIGNYQVDAVGKQKSKMVIGLILNEEEINDPNLVHKITFLATRNSRNSKRKVSLYIGVNRNYASQAKEIITKIDPEIRKNIKIVTIPNERVN